MRFAFEATKMFSAMLSISGRQEASSWSRRCLAGWSREAPGRRREDGPLAHLENTAARSDRRRLRTGSAKRSHVADLLAKDSGSKRSYRIPSGVIRSVTIEIGQRKRKLGYVDSRCASVPCVGVNAESLTTPYSRPLCSTRSLQELGTNSSLGYPHSVSVCLDHCDDPCGSLIDAGSGCGDAQIRGGSIPDVAGSEAVVPRDSKAVSDSRRLTVKSF
nr:hypothetical protein CFP56_07429 [Quercus suber]